MVQCLISFEMVFPPSFFNIMTHLLVHIVKEINILGPVFLHNMFPFERYMAVLKKYVHNRSRPEGCIAKGYGKEEVIEFCVDFIVDLSPIGVPMSRHEGSDRNRVPTVAAKVVGVRGWRARPWGRQWMGAMATSKGSGGGVEGGAHVRGRSRGRETRE